MRLLATGLAATLALPALARIPGENLYIAGDGFSLEQAVADAVAQRTANEAPGRILAIGLEVKRLARAGSSFSVRDSLGAARRNGSTVYVCAKDLRGAGLASGDLLPGVRVVRGWGDPAQDGAREQFPMAPGRRMRSLCAE